MISLMYLPGLTTTNLLNYVMVNRISSNGDRQNYRSHRRVALGVIEVASIQGKSLKSNWKCSFLIHIILIFHCQLIGILVVSALCLMVKGSRCLYQHEKRFKFNTLVLHQRLIPLNFVDPPSDLNVPMKNNVFFKTKLKIIVVKSIISFYLARGVVQSHGIFTICI